MSKNKRACSCLPGLVGVLIAIGLTIFTEDRTFAQITPDTTLGTEGSMVTPNSDVKGLPAELIEGGATRGTNLFHSFLEFNIGEGQRTYFANPAQIENILSRVTGNNPSNLLGTLGVLGNANLFFINPNGIIFGPNAQLDIRGSFVASTANSIVFNNGFEFSATNPQAPPLLTINITPGLQYGMNKPEATIANAGKLAVGQNLTLSAGNLDLQGELDAGRDLTLQAQNKIQVHDSASLLSGRDMVFQAPVRILGNASYTTGGYLITQQTDGAIVDFLIPHEQVIKADGDVSLTDDYNDQSLYILAGGKVTLSNVTITQAGNETITESISNGMGGMQTISIKASDRPTLDVRAGIDWNRIPGGLPGNTASEALNPSFDNATDADITIGVGSITVNAPNGLVSLTNQFQPKIFPPNILVIGNVTADSIATNVSIDTFENTPTTGISGGSVFIDSKGAIEINGLINTSFYASDAEGSPVTTDGSGGDVTLIANGDITLNDIITGVAVDNPLRVDGNGGNVVLDSGGNITLNGDVITQIIVSPSGDNPITVNARSGDVSIHASGDIVLNGSVNTGTEGFVSEDNPFTINGSGGLGGAISLDSDATIYITGGTVSNNSFFVPSGTANGIHLSAESVMITDGGTVSTDVFTLPTQTANAGSVIIEATQKVSLENGKVTSATSGGGTGKGGDIFIVAPSVFLTNSHLSSTSFSEGDAGNVSIQASNTVSLDNLSHINSETRRGGQGGNIEIATSSLMVKSGSQLRSTTSGQGNAGNVTITATAPTQSVKFDGMLTGVFTNVTTGATGNGGTIEITAPELSLTNGAILSASTSSTNTSGKGKAGAITVNANQINLFGAGSSILAETERAAAAGELKLQPYSNNSTLTVNLSDNAQISASTSGSGAGGKLTVIAPEAVTISGNGTLSAQTTGSGKAGDITLETGTLTVDGARILATATQQATGAAGTLTLKPFGAGQTLNVNLNNALISASTAGSGAGGNLTVIAPEAVTISGNGTLFTQTSGSGLGGTIDITTQKLNVEDATISASTSGTGSAGNILVQGADFVSLSNSLISTAVQAGAHVNATTMEPSGNINIQTRQLSLANNSQVTASTFGQGKAGNISVRNADNISLANSSITTAVNKDAVGGGGTITLQTRSLSLNDSQISASTDGMGNAGSINIQSADSVFLKGSGKSSISTAVNYQAIGNGGNIDIQTRSLSLDNAKVSAFTAGRGNAGSINVQNADTVVLSGNSKISTAVNQRAQGQGGAINLQTRSLSLNDSQIAASTDGMGNAGSINVQSAVSVSLNHGTISTEIKEKGIATQPNLAGNIAIQTRQLSLTNSSKITASTSGQGDAGSITVKNQNLQNGDFISLNNSSITTAVNEKAKGQGGTINLQTRSLSLDNAQLSARSDGQGEAGSITVGDSDTVSLANNSLVSTETSNTGKAGDITMTTGTLTVEDSQVSATTTSGESSNATGGKVNINANQVNLSGNHDNGLFARTKGVANAGDITLQAETLTVDGAQILATATQQATGAAGTLTLKPFGTGETLNVNLSNNALISASTSGSGTGGSLRVIAPEAVTIQGNGKLSADTFGSGQAGNVDINTQTLNVQNEAKISASTSNSGAGGSITVIAPEAVTLSGNSELSTDTTGTGQGGKIEIASDALTIDGATISASSSGQGNAGSITIATNKLIAQNGAQVSASTSGSGLGGTITVTADNFQANSGAQFLTNTFGSNHAGNIIFNVQDAFSLAGEGTGLSAKTERGSSGNGGSIFIDPRTVIIRDGAVIAVDSKGTGEGGKIFIQAGSLTLDNGTISADNQGTGEGGNIQIQTNSLTLDNGTISAKTASNRGGNINLDVQDLFLLRHGSKVSTTAGNEQAGGDGGNIDIKARFIIASPNEDNDITANAFKGNGGRINIETRGIFGLEERRAIPDNQTNDIDASSEFGINGVVNINRLDTDPNQGLVELPEAPVNLDSLQACRANTKEASSFVDTRRGGVPSNPHEISNNTVWEDTRSPSAFESQSLQDSSPAKQIVEAQGWIVDADGKVILTTQASTATPNSGKIALACQAAR